MPLFFSREEPPLVSKVSAPKGYEFMRLWELGIVTKTPNNWCPVCHQHDSPATQKQPPRDNKLFNIEKNGAG